MIVGSKVNISAKHVPSGRLESTLYVISLKVRMKSLKPGTCAHNLATVLMHVLS
jgi:hypothetical protein